MFTFIIIVAAAYLTSLVMPKRGTGEPFSGFTEQQFDEAWEASLNR